MSPRTETWEDFGSRWPCSIDEQLVAVYDPENEFVKIFITLAGGTLSSRFSIAPTGRAGVLAPSMN